MQFINGNFFCKFACCCGLFVFFFVIAVTPALSARSYAEPAVEDEIILTLWVKTIGSLQAPAILKNDTVFLQPADVFNFIKVRTNISTDGEVITGYYIDESRPYSINFSKHKITYLGRTINLDTNEYLVTSSGKYLRTDLFKTIFSLTCRFDYSGLSIEIISEETLPAESIYRATQAQKKARPIFDDTFMPDRDFGLKRSLFSFGALDYSAADGYVGNFLKSTDFSNNSFSYSLLAGGQLLGGDFDAAVAADQTSHALTLDRAIWQWRYAIPDSRLLSQIIIGKRATFSNLFSADTLLGIQVTNANLNYRTSYANYTISDYTDPYWTAELYVNEGLVSYTKADQTGYYKFVFPLPYGTTNVSLIFRGPYGEVRTKTIELRIPYAFLPPGEIEYTLSGGRSYHTSGTKNTIGKLDLNVGINPWMSLAGGVQYLLDTSHNSNFFPFITTSLRLASDVLFAGEYYYKNGFRTSLNITGLAGASLSASYDHPFAGSLQGSDQVRILDERKFQLNLPLRFLGASFRLNAVEIPQSNGSGFISASSQLLLHVFGGSFDVSANSSILRNHFQFGLLGDWTGSIGYSSMVFGILVHPAAYINYSNHDISELSLSFLKNISPSYTLGFTVSHNFSPSDFRVQADIHMRFPFAAFGITSAGGTNEVMQSGATLQGSMMYDPYGKQLLLSDRPQVRHGIVDIIPFLDANNNGRLDSGETIVKHLGLEQSFGRVTEREDGTLSISELEPYRRYVMKFSPKNLENISWVPKFQSFAINPAANGVTVLEVPILTSGQIEGYVNLVSDEKREEPLGGVRILIKSLDTGDTLTVKLSQDILTFSNGEFFYAGLTPGKYRLEIDPSQLAFLHYKCTPPYIDFDLKSKEDGEMVEGLNFKLK